MNEIKLVVALGASAGGLEALESFFKHLPENTDMAFIVIMHLDPEHVSILPELLQRYTKMEVIKIKDGTKLQANKIYVIPPNHNLSIFDAQFQLFDLPKSRAGNLPIDSFFKALAQDQGSHAAAIILSGTGSDGSQGLKEIKAENGIVMVQNESSAKYDGMPRNAIATGMVDFILSPDQLPDKLIRYAKRKDAPLFTSTREQNSLRENIQKILILIRNQTGHDFSQYKKNTIFRRIERRIYVHQLKEIHDYLLFLQKNEQEVNVLFKELLIGVTSFFRDPDAFDLLKTTILPQILKDKPDNHTIRVWVCGCSTGEEAYSIAISIQECLLQLKRSLNVQIFGTDLDGKAIDIARNGLYPMNIVGEMSKDYCNRYFNEENGQYRIKKSIRETLIFATQNLIKDPPFTKLDLLCCRNLLIYFTPELQKKVFPIFHYSLNKDGILFLGSSETTGQGNQYFDTVDKKWKVFKRKPLKDSELTRLTMTDSNDFVKMPDVIVKKPPLTYDQENNMLQIVEAILKNSAIPACVVIDYDKNIIYVHGRLGRYLDPAEGHVSRNIIEMARTDTLRNELINCLKKAEIHKKKIQKKAIKILTEDEKSLLDLSVIPLQKANGFKNTMIVVFEQSTKGSDLNTATSENHIVFHNVMYSCRGLVIMG